MRHLKGRCSLARTLSCRPWRHHLPVVLTPVSRAFSFPLLVPGHHKDKKESKRAGKDAKASAGAAHTRVPCARPVRTTHVRVAADGQQDVH